MKKRYLGPMLATAMALTACEAGSGANTDPTALPVGVASSQAAPEAVKTPPVDSRTIKLGQIATGSVDLPAGVRDQIDAVVKVQIQDKEKASVLSGVAIEGGYLTSGHGLIGDKGNLRMPGCRDMWVVRQLGSRPGYEVPMPQSAQARNKTGLNEEHVDLAYLRNPDNQPEPATMAPLTSGPEDAFVGETVYFVNFEPLSDGTSRGPNELDPKLRTPAIYSGRVLLDPSGNDKQITVLTSTGESFGGVQEDRTRGGASGGAIFRTDGTLLGVTTAVTEFDMPVDYIEETYEVDIDDTRKRTDYQLSFVQPVDAMIVSDFRDSVAAPVPC